MAAVNISAGIRACGKQLKSTLMDNKHEHISGKARAEEELVARTFIDTCHMSTTKSVSSVFTSFMSVRSVCSSEVIIDFLL